MDFGSILEVEARETKLYFSGTHRIRTPRATYERYRDFFPKFGITRVSNLTGLDKIGIPVWQCIRPNGRGFAIAYGKGATHDAAIASAMMEAIETWHAEHCDTRFIYDSWQRMRRRFPAVVDLARLPRRSFRTPRGDQMRMWVEGFDLITSSPMWVPAARAIFGLTGSPDTDVAEDTNGLSSGNSHSEAIVHAICELIERDAVALWQHSEEDLTANQVKIDSIRDENCAGMIRRLHALDLVLGVWDVTPPDIGVPCYVAAISDRPGRPHAIGGYQAYGCHLDPAVALSRAITEAAQARVALISGAAEDIDDAVGDRRTTDEELAQIEREIEGSPASRSFDRVSLATDSPAGDIRTLVNRLREADIASVVAVPLTKPEFNVPVVRVVTTDLQNIGSAPTPRLRGGRSALKSRAQ